MNRILAALPASSRCRSLLEPVKLVDRQELERPNWPIDFLYFIETGVAAVVSRSGETQIAFGLVGCEGVSGVAIIMGDDHSPQLTTMLSEGTAHRIGANALRSLLEEEPELKRLLLRYSLAFFSQAAHTALANAAGSISERLARWILMMDDRMDGSQGPLTHQRISYMIHTRRAGITTALKTLRSSGLIEVGRGYISVLNRTGLESIAGRFYGRPEVEFERLIATPWPPVKKAFPA